MPTAHQWTPLIIAHTGIALTALVLGAILLNARKGNRTHRTGGWVWVLCIATVAGVSFAIRGSGGFSWIHGLSAFTLCALAWGVLCARMHRVARHRSAMIAIYFGALVITGLFTLMPNRLIGNVVWRWLGI